MVQNPKQDSNNPYATSGNPYQASTQYAPVQARVIEDVYKKRGLPWIFGKWLLICYLCAGPSFFFGLMVTDGTVGAITGMVVGVFCYVVGYTIFECTPLVQRSLQDRIIRRAATIGYLTRIVFSLFPVLAPLDMFLGIASTTGGSYVLKLFYPTSGAMLGAENQAFAPALTFSFSATIIQGALMNVVLLGFVALVYGVCCLVMDPLKRSTGWWPFHNY